MGRAVLFLALSSSCVKEVLQFLAGVVSMVHAGSCNPVDLASSHCIPKICVFQYMYKSTSWFKEKHSTLHIFVTIS